MLTIFSNAFSKINRNYDIFIHFHCFTQFHGNVSLRFQLTELALPWTNVDLNQWSNIYLTRVVEEAFKISTHKMCLEIKFLKLLSHPSGANESRHLSVIFFLPFSDFSQKAILCRPWSLQNVVQGPLRSTALGWGLLRVRPLTHWGRDKMDAISQTTLSNAFSCMKMFQFRLKFHWSLFLRVQLTIFQHWFR